MAGMDGYGVELRRGDGLDPETFTALGDPTNVSGPAIERNTIDVTSHQSPNGWMEFLGGLKNAGEVSVDLNYQPVTHDPLVDDFEDKQPRNWELAFPDDEQTVWEVQLILIGYEPASPVDDKAEATLTFQASGKPNIRTGG